jgi:hypothetical protein
MLKTGISKVCAPTAVMRSKHASTKLKTVSHTPITGSTPKEVSKLQTSNLNRRKLPERHVNELQFIHSVPAWLCWHCAGSHSVLLETWMALFGERRGLPVGRSWATRIFAVGFAFFSVVTMAACTLQLGNAFSMTCLDIQLPRCKSG